MLATVIHFLKGIWEELAEKGGTHPMTRAGDAIIIALHSGQRLGDVLAMPPRIFRAGRCAH